MRESLLLERKKKKKEKKKKHMPVDSVIKLATICFCYLSIRDKPHNGGWGEEGGGPLLADSVSRKILNRS